MQLRRATQFLSTLCVAALISACGGGGDGGSSGGSGGPLLPTLSQDVVPSGPRIDVSARNYLPLHAGDTWVYAKTLAGNLAGGVVTRSIATAPDQNGRLTISESDGGQAEVSANRITAAGLETLDPIGASGIWPGVYAALPAFTDVPTPFYPAGGIRKVIRQGDMLADVDGDAKNDFFRIEITQAFVGFEPLTVLGRSIEVAHFRTTLAFTVAGTSTGTSATGTAIEDSWLADGLGLVRAERSATYSDGSVLVKPYSLDLVSATVNGQTSTTSGRAVNIAVYHRGLVFVASRGVFLATVSPSDPVNANRIATIQASNGAVTYSAPIGSGPGAMSVSADGNVLYVGLEGSGEVLKLALPSMQELARVRLPVDPFFGQLLPEDISVSPTSADVFAVSMTRTNSSPRHAGVALVRGMVVQPQRTQQHTGSNRIAFDIDGGWLYGYNNESTEFGLRRIEVLSDGLIERLVVTANARYATELNVSNGLAVLGDSVFSADASLALRGTIASAAGCTKLPGVGKIACQSTLNYNQLVIVDSVTFSQLASTSYSTNASNSEWRLVPGAAGQVAVSEYGRIVIFTSVDLE